MLFLSPRKKTKPIGFIHSMRMRINEAVCFIDSQIMDFILLSNPNNPLFNERFRASETKGVSFTMKLKVRVSVHGEV